MPCNDSILLRTKELLGPEASDPAFDTEIITHLNMAFAELHQINGQSNSGFMVTGPEQTYLDYTEDERLLGFLETYLYLKVKMVFDPPSSSSVLQSFERTIDRLESRINYQTDPGEP